MAFSHSKMLSPVGFFDSKTIYKTDSSNITLYDSTEYRVKMQGFLNNRFVALLENDTNFTQYNTKTIASTNGTTWSNIGSGLPLFREWENIIYGNNAHVAFGLDANNVWKIMTSTDNMLTWFDVSQPSFPALNNHDFVVFTNNFFYRGSGNLLQYSSDGVNWAITTLPVASDFYVENVIYGNNIYIAFGFGLKNQICVSSNGTNWSNVQIPFPYLSNIKYGNGIFLISYFNQIAYSTNGQNWTTLTLSLLPSSVQTRISYLNGQFYMFILNQQYQVASSSDGINWDFFTANIPVYGNPIYCNGYFVFNNAPTPEPPQLLISKDAKSWRPLSVLQLNYIKPRLLNNQQNQIYQSSANSEIVFLTLYKKTPTAPFPRDGYNGIESYRMTLP